MGEAAATPQLVAEMPDLASLRAQAAMVLPRLRARTAGAPFTADPSDPAGTISGARERLATLCGVRLPILTTVSLPASGPWQQDLVGNQIHLAGAEPAKVRARLYAHARVRLAVRALLSAYDQAETLTGGAVLDVRATQLSVAGAPSPSSWVGTDPAPRDGMVDLVVQRSFAGNVPAIVTGLAVDAWTHVVPATTLTTGVAFHYNEPDTTPPQAVLIAVSPDLRPEHQPAQWDLDTLLEVLTSTLALTRDRAVAAELATISGLTLPDAP